MPRSVRLRLIEQGSYPLETTHFSRHTDRRQAGLTSLEKWALTHDSEELYVSMRRIEAVRSRRDMAREHRGNDDANGSLGVGHGWSSQRTSSRAVLRLSGGQRRLQLVSSGQCIAAFQRYKADVVHRRTAQVRAEGWVTILLRLTGNQARSGRCRLAQRRTPARQRCP